MAVTYHLMEQAELACQALDESVMSNKKYLRANPEAASNQQKALSLPDGFKTFDDFIYAQKERMACF